MLPKLLIYCLSNGCIEAIKINTVNIEIILIVLKLFLPKTRTLPLNIPSHADLEYVRIIDELDDR